MRERVRGKELRCAVYTRKSSEEGLEQDFNSLHAQREACEAYITSQKHEGWRALASVYDDGGFSGGSMERPGLAKLLADIASGQIDIVVVYKVDRLTRSLTDFARIVEVFDRHHVSFVSVTQAFNTTTSMGRLTLNVLLSFAQFEREVTGERIRDKIAASKRKGLWMGGFVPLGYEASGRTLVINEGEAETVRTIYARYLQLRNVDALKADLERRGFRTKVRAGQGGAMAGGTSFSRGHLYRILSNPLYIGEIAHKRERYAGQHAAIVDRETWDAVQATLKSNAHQRRVKRNAREPNLLSGLLFDHEGRLFTSTHAVSDGKRYRYYVARDGGQGRAWRLPASEIETAVIGALRRLLSDHHQLIETMRLEAASPDQLIQVFGAAEVVADQLGQSTSRCREALFALVRQLVVSEQELRVKLLPEALHAGNASAWSTNGPEPLLTVPIGFARRQSETRIVIPGRRSGSVGTADPALIKAIARGYAWFEELASGRADTVVEIARREQVTDRYVSCLMKLAFLSPELVEDGLAGRYPRALSTKRLTLDINLPLLWGEQERALGYLNQATSTD